MNRQKKSLLIRVLGAVLCAVLLAALLPPGALAEVSQAEIEALRAERDEIEKQREAKQAEIDALKEDAVGILVQKRALDERNMYTMQQIQLNEEEIALYDEMIADKEKEVLDAQMLEEQQLDRYRKRVRAMEENGTLNYLALILKSNDLGEMLTAMDDVGEIMLRDKELEDNYIRARENTEEVKAEYEAYRKEVNGKQDALRQDQEKLKAEIDEADELLLGLHEDYMNRQAEIAEIQAQEDATNMAISILVAKLEAERAAAAAAAAAAAGGGGDGGSTGGGAAAYANGTFIFPVATYSYISSRFGERIHPITGELKNHNGMDIAANSGTAVYAADGGRVVLAEWYGGYGNCIMIEHGNGYKTLYGHLSYIGVKNGQYVNQGDTIGQVGSTGNSTGPHLHFEVYSNGSRIDPEQFYSGLNISADAGV
ncbi:MAG: peptidoglycan DD-metalloendopeptidase family protein [Oscillospiraceae bacterium]|nr:peptidoglycan DD-metalloendopeptidase family protein [Oscillospiraceae bacterium]